MAVTPNITSLKEDVATNVKEESSGVKQEDPIPVIELIEIAGETLFKGDIVSVKEESSGVKQ